MHVGCIVHSGLAQVNIVRFDGYNKRGGGGEIFFNFFYNTPPPEKTFSQILALE